MLMNNMQDEMSSNIADLSNMKELSNNIQKELDEGKASNYLNQDGLDALQQMQLKQLQELQKMQELQISNKEEVNEEDSDSESESESKRKVKKNKKSSSSNSIINLLQDPVVILALYIVLSHPTVLGMIGKYIPNLVEGEDGVSLTNLLIRGIIMVTIYFGLKMFVLK